MGVTPTNGDWLIVVARSQSSSQTADWTASGWARIGSTFTPSEATTRGHGIYRYIVGSTAPPGSHTFTGASGSTGDRYLFTMFVVRGVDATNPIAGNSDYLGAAYSATPNIGRTVASFTTTFPALQILAAGSEITSGNSTTATLTPAGYTQVVAANTSATTTISRTALWVGALAVSATPTAAATVAWQNGAAPHAESVTLLGSTAPPAAPANPGLAVLDGSGSTVKLFYTTDTAGSLATPSDSFYIPKGFATISDALAKKGFTCGHRGNSTRYAECSLRAYTMTAARGHGMLEISLGRSSDGVWFGLHDADINRTSGLAAGTVGAASSMTWAQISAYQNKLGSEGRPQPYARWQDILAAYSSSHVFMVDPKYAYSSNVADFWALVSGDLGPTKAMIKFYGSYQTLAADASNRGYQSWGFFYQSDYDADAGVTLAKQAAYPWTTLGMDYTASQTAWNAVLSTGKKVIGHIAPDQAAYNTAMSKGAWGVQCSGTDVVAPVSAWSH